LDGTIQKSDGFKKTLCSMSASGVSFLDGTVRKSDDSKKTGLFYSFHKNFKHRYFRELNKKIFLEKLAHDLDSPFVRRTS